MRELRWLEPRWSRSRLASRNASSLLLVPLASAAERLRDALVDVRRLIAEAALVAQPAVVDALVIAREDAHHALVAHGELDVALRGAARADSPRTFDIPGARAKSVSARG